MTTSYNSPDGKPDGNPDENPDDKPDDNLDDAFNYPNINYISNRLPLKRSKSMATIFHNSISTRTSTGSSKECSATSEYFSTVH
jgi:hypothetical protein